ncbi:hypothetical protein BKA70DRAFT_1436369 [Coprinopsis sp. MPI-PUGE-AT-0042]|nr:hypothetical protein BKA70DRAFT_1436369 [Coprinopsis sp. MPI-PUGE-AT-0042]
MTTKLELPVLDTLEILSAIDISVSARITTVSLEVVGLELAEWWNESCATIRLVLVVLHPELLLASVRFSLAPGSYGVPNLAACKRTVSVLLAIIIARHRSPLAGHHCKPSLKRTALRAAGLCFRCCETLLSLCWLMMRPENPARTSRNTPLAPTSVVAAAVGVSGSQGRSRSRRWS